MAMRGSRLQQDLTNNNKIFPEGVGGRAEVVPRPIAPYLSVLHTASMHPSQNAKIQNKQKQEQVQPQHNKRFNNSSHHGYTRPLPAASLRNISWGSSNGTETA